MSNRSRSLRALGALAVLMWMGAVAQADTLSQFNLPEQPLADALRALGSQTNINVLYYPPMVAGYRAPALTQKMSADEALTKLLAGTGLAYKFLNEHTVVLSAKEASAGAAPVSLIDKGLAGAVQLAQSGGSDSGTAQSAGKQEATGSGAETPKLEEVVVTAQKRAVAENIKDVPMTINAISGETLQKRGIGDVKELTFAVPSLSFHSYGAGTGILNIRGIGGERGTAPTVGLYLDDIPIESAYFLNANTNSGLDVRTYDLERVEVLKGPQGTLFGESSLGGLIRYVTKDPKLDRVEGRVEGTFFGTQDGDPSEQLVGAFNVPLVNDVLGLRIAGTYEKNGGWIDQLSDFSGPVVHRDINDNSLTDIRGKLLYAPTSALRMTALVNVHRNHFGGLNVVNVHPFSMSEFVQGSGANSDYPTAGYDNFNIYNLTAQYNFGFATLLSSTSRFDSRIRTTDTQGTLSNLGAADQPEQFGLPDELLIRPSDEGAFARVTSQEIRLTSNGAGPAKWLVGASWKKSRSLSGHAGGYDFVFPLGFDGQSPPVVFADQGVGLSSDSSSKILAGFTDGSYTFFGRLEIGAGVRVYHEKQDAKNFDANDALTLDQNGTFRKTTYRGFAKYHLSDQVNLYANAATGFRSGQFNGPPAIAIGIAGVTKPENSIFYEAGMKSTFLNNMLGLDLAIFKGLYKDQLQGAFVLSSATGYFVNAGTGDIKGIEWRLSMAPVSRLRFGFGGDVLKTKYTKINEDNPSNSVAVGDPMDFVPKYDLNFTTDYAFDWGSSVPGFVNVSYSRKGPMQHSNRNTGILLYIDRTEPTNLLQASLGATVSGFEFTLFARNILDERKSLNPGWAGVWNQERPRSFGLSVAKSF